MNEIDNLIKTLMESTTRYIVRRIQGEDNKAAYKYTMGLYINNIDQLRNKALTYADIDSLAKEPMYYKYLWWTRVRKGIHHVELASHHAKEIMASVDKRFVKGMQDEPSGLLRNRSLHVYSDE